MGLTKGSSTARSRLTVTICLGVLMLGISYIVVLITVLEANRKMKNTCLYPQTTFPVLSGKRHIKASSVSDRSFPSA